MHEQRPRGEWVRPMSVLRFWISEGLTQAESQSQVKGWKSQAHREFPRNREHLSLASPSAETGRGVRPSTFSATAQAAACVLAPSDQAAGQARGARPGTHNLARRRRRNEKRLK